MSKVNEKYASEALLSEEARKKLGLVIKNGSVTTDKLKDGAVTPDKLEPGLWENIDSTNRETQEGLNRLQEWMNEFAGGLEITANTDSYEAGKSAYVTITAKTKTGKKGDWVIRDSNNVTVYEKSDASQITYTQTIDKDTYYSIACKQGDQTATGQWAIIAAFPTWLGAGSSYTDIKTDAYKRVVDKKVEGRYEVTVASGQKIYLLTPKEVVISKVTMGGFEIPMNDVEEVTLDISGYGNKVYKVYESSNTYQEGTYQVSVNVSDSELVEHIEAIDKKIDNYPVADGEDIVAVTKTQPTEQQVLMLADKAYHPASFSGLGRKYLRKNIIPIEHEYRVFGGFVENVEAASSVPSIINANPNNVFFDRVREKFFYHMGSKYYMSWSSEEVPVSDYALTSEPLDMVFMYGGVPYKWDGENLLVDDEIQEDGLMNLLTQDMINEPNTIYHIQYDYDLNEQAVSVPEGCTLEFEGGSFKNGTIDFNNAKIIAGLNKIFDNISFSTIYTKDSGKPEWFGAIGDGSNDDTSAIQACVDRFKTTELIGNSYKITTINVEPIANTLGRNIINNSNVVSQGNGFSLNAHCKYRGGRIVVSADSVGITLGREDSVEAHNRMTVQDVVIVAASKDNSYGIKCIALSGNHYNAFCHIDNVKIWGCTHGFYGNIRASYINVFLEGCFDNFHGTNCSLNMINVAGNASKKSDDYPYFITIEGNNNIINTMVYDIGNPNFQPYLITMQGAGNKVTGTGYIPNTDTTNTCSSPYFSDGLLEVENPIYTVTYSNVQRNSRIEKGFFSASFIEGETTVPYTTLYKIDSSQEGYIEFNFGRVFGFSAIKFINAFNNNCFSKIEIRRDASDDSPFIASTNDGGSPSTEAYATSYFDFWYYEIVEGIYRPRWNPNLSVRCYLKNANTICVRGKLFAVKAQKDQKSFSGTLENIPSSANLGDFYLITDIKRTKTAKGLLAVYDGTKWVDDNGIPIDTLYNASYASLKSSFTKYVNKTPGYYQMVKLVISTGNPMQIYIPLFVFNSVGSNGYNYGGLLSFVGNPSTNDYKVVYRNTFVSNYIMTLNVFEKYSGGKMTIILCPQMAGGFYMFLDLQSVITNSTIESITALSSDEDTSAYNNHSFMNVPNSITSTTRRLYTSARKGECKFDENLNKPLWWNGTAWVDATGAVVQ